MARNDGNIHSVIGTASPILPGLYPTQFAQDELLRISEHTLSCDSSYDFVPRFPQKVLTLEEDPM